MKVRRWWLLALILVIALVGAACGDDGDDDAAEDDDDAKEAPTFPAGTTMKALQDKGKIVVGTKFDQPGFGQKNPTTNQIEGFDVEVAKLIAEGIFGEGGGDKVEFVEAVSAVREDVIADGKVDLVVATYTINDARKQRVDFAGPYFVAGQDIMVKSDNDEIKGVEDLNGKKVCSAQGSTSITNLQEKAPRADTSIQFKTYSECAAALTDGRVEAVTTDNVILVGLVEQSRGAFKIVNNPFTQEPYGIGLKKGDDQFRDFVNDRLEEIYENGEWADAFESTAGKAGLKTPTPPRVDRYQSGGPAAATGGTTTSAPATGGTTTSAPATTTTSVQY